eukprot:COSAG06_NODE_52290_length_306_cov_1.487923_1_plen_54_part_01
MLCSDHSSDSSSLEPAHSDTIVGYYLGYYLGTTVEYYYYYSRLVPWLAWSAAVE